MKPPFLFLLLTCGGAAAAYHHAPCLLSALHGESLCAHVETGASGTYIEARSVTVFAGACHYNSEVQSQGRQALVGWSFEGGSFDGVALAGCAIAAAVSSDANLQEGSARRSIVYLDAVDDARRTALIGWLRQNAREVLGEILETRDADVRVAQDDASFVLRAGDELVATGATMADLSCCTMPENRWYEPLGETADQAIVGMSTACRFDGAGTLPAWTYADANNAFVARFGGPDAAATGCCGAASREALSE